MKLDLPAIHKLSPPRLYALADLRAFVLLLVQVIELGIGSARDTKSYARWLAQHTGELHTKARANLNLKIKAWVLACPDRIAQARLVIGEVTIRRWISRLRATYMSPGYTGGGLREDRLAQEAEKKLGRRYRPRTCKPFALVRVSEVERLLPFRPRWSRKVRPAFYGETGNLRHAARLAYTGHSKILHRSKSASGQKPVRFFPSELGINFREVESKKQTQKPDESRVPKSPEKLPEKPPKKPPKKPVVFNKRPPPTPLEKPP